MFQRNEGVVELAFARRGSASYARRMAQRGSMKVRFPNVAAGAPPEAVLVNISGGLTGGDRCTIGVKLDTEAAATVTTQACEKIYRSPEGDALVDVALDLKPGTALDWLPQPAILFDRSRLKRRTVATMAADAQLLAVEAVIFGRTAMGEDMLQGALSDDWAIRRDGRLIHDDRFRAAGEVAALLDRPSVLNGARAMATLRYVAPDALARLEEMRELLATLACNAAASAWNGMLVVRLIAPDGYALTKTLIALLIAFRGAAPRAWSI